MTIQWLVEQLQWFTFACHDEALRPRPRGASGVIRPGGATEAVLQWLRANPGRYYEQGEIRRATGCTHSAVSWALIYLQALGHIEAVPDARNARYLRYGVAVPHNPPTEPEP